MHANMRFLCTVPSSSSNVLPPLFLLPCTFLCCPMLGAIWSRLLSARCLLCLSREKDKQVSSAGAFVHPYNENKNHFHPVSAGELTHTWGNLWVRGFGVAVFRSGLFPSGCWVLSFSACFSGLDRWQSSGRLCPSAAVGCLKQSFQRRFFQDPASNTAGASQAPASSLEIQHAVLTGPCLNTFWLIKC